MCHLSYWAMLHANSQCVCLLTTWPLKLTIDIVFAVTECDICISQVVPVSYVRFSATPVLYTSTRESPRAFPLGSVLTFTVHFHASGGEALHSSSSHLTFSTNRSVHLTNNRNICHFVAVIYWLNLNIYKRCDWVEHDLLIYRGGRLICFLSIQGKILICFCSGSLHFFLILQSETEF